MPSEPSSPVPTVPHRPAAPEATRTAAAGILTCLQKVSNRSGSGLRDVFVDWLDMTHTTLRQAPAIVEAQLAGRRYRDPAAAAAKWKRWRARYGEAAFGHLSEAAGQLFASTFDGLGDVVGTVYMEGRVGGHAGQFFTPMPVAQLMAATLVDGVEAQVRERVAPVLEEHPEARFALMLATIAPQAATGPAVTSSLLELSAAIEPVTVHDPTVGSGVMLLAAAAQLPEWMVRCGFVTFSGTDIDPVCVAMAQLNMDLFGLNQRPIRVGDALAPAEQAS